MQRATVAERLHRRRASGPGAGERDLQRRLRQQLQALDIHPPLDVTAMCRAMSEKRGRHIELRPFPMPMPGPLGLWVDTPAADLIVYQQHTTRLHQDHIILHEIGHIMASEEEFIAEDPSDPAEGWWAGVIPALNAAGIRRVRQRCGYDSQEECEVELGATIVMEWSSVLDRTAAAVPLDPAVRRVNTALSGNRGWL
ncbi:hypothetical protein ACFW17_07395 [Streptomyces sp. NPDC058961]|uniref:hypothetical protein n=1 Tax=Streptomyces sp. NPDC058961 TaxID=3346680 RepID=UPI0036C3C548